MFIDKQKPCLLGISSNVILNQNNQTLQTESSFLLKFCIFYSTCSVYDFDRFFVRRLNLPRLLQRGQEYDESEERVQPQTPASRSGRTRERSPPRLQHRHCFPESSFAIEFYYSSSLERWISSIAQTLHLIWAEMTWKRRR